MNLFPRARKMGKVRIEIEYEDASDFDIDRVIVLAWKELDKCELVDVVSSRHGRTCYKP